MRPQLTRRGSPRAVVGATVVLQDGAGRNDAVEIRQAPGGVAAGVDGPVKSGEAMLALVDELAALAADLWWQGKLDDLVVEEDRSDADAE